MNRTMPVEIWSDLICPWCWIGKRRFERALADFAHRDQVRLVHRAFRLTPGLSPEPLDAFMQRRLGSQAQFGAMRAEVERAAAAEGLRYDPAGAEMGDTLDVHRLVLFAASQGRQPETVERFHRAYFSEHASLFDRETLIGLAMDAGLERDDARSVLDGAAHTQEALVDQVRAQSLGAGGVPFFLVDGRIAASGAQTPRHFLSALTQAWDLAARVPEPEPDPEDDASACGPDACATPSP
jgi:predicted DsbA family dithiol-disulfide isomerase